MTQIAQELELTSPEVSRHLSRLNESKIVQKDLQNYYHITRYGRHILRLVNEINFFTKNREYFVSHDALKIPSTFIDRISELSKYNFSDNFMGFLHFIDEKIKEATEFIWLYIDQYPITALESLLDSVERGVKVRIIEQSDLSGPNVSFKNQHLIAHGDEPPEVMIKTSDRKDLYLFVSNVGSAVSFPTENGFDYAGFTTDEREFGAWSEELFNHYLEYK
jgi:predicted transcriptional regulator